MIIKRPFRKPVKFCYPSFGKSPKGLNTVNMFLSTCKFISSMMDSVMLLVANINQAIITSPTIRVNHTIRRHFAADNSLQRCLSTIWNYFSIDFTSVVSQRSKEQVA